MLYITFTGPNNPWAMWNWHVGQPPHDYHDCTITRVQADGDELDFIASNFHNIPVAIHKRVNIWNGPFADFIARNL